MYWENKCHGEVYNNGIKHSCENDGILEFTHKNKQDDLSSWILHGE